MSALTMDAVRAAFDLVNKTSFSGYRIQTVQVRIGPARMHSKRRNGSKASYHRRVQKKWNRRYGTVDRTPVKPGEAYMLSGKVLGMPDVLLVREDDMPRLREVLARI